ncbi:MAG: hypothetical protein MUF15_20360 [Acidobacteria bacterium]|jgi:hypothetical protein|nr:hypothetical protein [Acidobacteriota bacterium]
MKKISFDLDRYICTNNSSKLTQFQEYALEVCKEFNLSGQYKAMIFRYAKHNMAYLQGKVANAREKLGGEEKNKGHYLISLFRKNKPWN